MISILSAVDKSEHQVLFLPRKGTSIGAKEIRRKLMYGYHCSFCRNVILFAFLTEEKVPLKKYEETRVVNGANQFHMMIPGPHAGNQDTAYVSEFFPIPGQNLGLQRVYLKGHVVSEDLIGEKYQSVEAVGAKVCPYSCIYGTRKELLIKDTMILGNFTTHHQADYNMPTWEQFQGIVDKSEYLYFAEGIGFDAEPPLPMVGVRSDWITEQKGNSQWRAHLLDYKKPPPPKESEAEAVAGELADDEQYFDADGNLVPESDLCSQCRAPNPEHGACRQPCL